MLRSASNAVPEKLLTSGKSCEHFPVLRSGWEFDENQSTKELVWSRWTHIIILVYHCIHKNNKDTLQHCNAGMQVKNSVDKFIQILDKNTIGVIHHIDNSEVWHAGTLYDQNQGMKRSAHWLLTKKARKCNPATLTGCGKWPASRVRSIYYFCPAIFDVCESPWNKSYCLRSMETKKHIQISQSMMPHCIPIQDAQLESETAIFHQAGHHWLKQGKNVYRVILKTKMSSKKRTISEGKEYSNFQPLFFWGAVTCKPPFDYK